MLTTSWQAVSSKWQHMNIVTWGGLPLPLVSEVSHLVESDVFDLIIQAQPQLRHITEQALHHDASNYIIPQHGTCEQTQEVVRLLPTVKPSWVSVTSPKAEQCMRTGCQLSAVPSSEAWCRVIAWRVCIGHSTRHAGLCWKASTFPLHGEGLNHRKWAVLCNMHSRAPLSSRTCTACQQVDLLDNIQEHLIFAVLQARPPPAHSTGDCECSVLGLLC